MRALHPQLTRRQEGILAFLEEGEGEVPLQAIASRFDISLKTAETEMDFLERSGWVESNLE